VQRVHKVDTSLSVDKAQTRDISRRAQVNYYKYEVQEGIARCAPKFNSSK
jgi:hypothetical protein